MRNSLISSIANHFGRTYSGSFVFQFVISAHLTGCPVCILPEGPGQLALHVPRHHLRRCSPPPPLRRRPLPHPTPFPYPLPQPPPTPPSQEPSCAIWPFGAAGPRGPRSAGAAGQCGPPRADRALGVRNRHTVCAESPCFIQSTESGRRREL
jgi:hypothetical protein